MCLCHFISVSHIAGSWFDAAFDGCLVFRSALQLHQTALTIGGRSARSCRTVPVHTSRDGLLSIYDVINLRNGAVNSGVISAGIIPTRVSSQKTRHERPSAPFNGHPLQGGLAFVPVERSWPRVG